MATTTADELDADVILVTHGHFDHIADVETIAKRTGALLIANYEIVTWFQNQGVDKYACDAHWRAACFRFWDRETHHRPPRLVSSRWQ